MGPKHPGKKVSKTTSKKKASARKDAPMARSVMFASIKSRTESFALPRLKEERGYAMDTTDSYKGIKSYGAVYHHLGKEKKRWICLASSTCADSRQGKGWKMRLTMEMGVNKKKKWKTSNAVRHLLEQHGIITKSSEKQREKAVCENQYRHELLQSYKNDMARLGELQWVLMIILCRLPISFGSYKVVRDTMHLTGIEDLKKNLHRVRVNHVITEIYNQALSVAKQQIMNSIKVHGERIFSINVDNWKSKNSVRKFTGIRLYFNDEQMKLQNWMLAVREFNPSSHIRQGPDGLRRAMRVWARAILLHYGLEFKNIFSATTDKAGDVRILCQLDIGTNWDWCPPHLMAKILDYACSLGRNPELYAEIAAMKAVISSLRDLTKDGNLFEEMLQEENPEAINKSLQSHQEQRFMGVYRTLKRYYEMFETINSSCQASGIVNQVKMSKDEIKQLLSLLHPLWEISQTSQKQKAAYGFRVLQKLIDERMKGVLNAKKSVRSFEDKNDIMSLSPMITRTRKLLIDAVDVKFFKRYFQKTNTTSSGDVTIQSYLLECQHLLHPAFRHLNPIMEVIHELVSTDSLAIAAWTAKNSKAAKRYAESMIARSLSSSSLNEIIREYMERKKNEYILHVQTDIFETVKNHIIDTIISNSPSEEEHFSDEEVEIPQQRNLQFASMEDYVAEQRGNQAESSSGAPARNNSTFLRRVSCGVDTYLKASATRDFAFKDFRFCCNIVAWIEKYGAKYPHPVSAMAAYFAVPTSSAGVELDFYFASLLLTKQRMSLHGPMIEMMHMIDRNQAWVDLSQVDTLTAREAIKAKPTFSGDDHLEEEIGFVEEEEYDHANDDENLGGKDGGVNDSAYTEFDEEENRRRMAKRRDDALAKRQREEELANLAKDAEEDRRFSKELAANLLKKQKLEEKRKTEREKHDRKIKRKEAKKQAKEEEYKLNEEVRKNEARKIDLKNRVKMRQNAEKELDAAHQKEQDEDNTRQVYDDEYYKWLESQQAEYREAEYEEWDERKRQEEEEKRRKDEDTTVEDKIAENSDTAVDDTERMNNDSTVDDTEGMNNDSTEDDTGRKENATTVDNSGVKDSGKAVEDNSRKENEPAMRNVHRHRDSVKSATSKSFFKNQKTRRQDSVQERRDLTKLSRQAFSRRGKIPEGMENVYSSEEDEYYSSEQLEEGDNLKDAFVPPSYQVDYDDLTDL